MASSVTSVTASNTDSVYIAPDGGRGQYFAKMGKKNGRFLQKKPPFLKQRLSPFVGFGWVVVTASFFVNMIADGVTFSFGIMFEEFQAEFSSSAAETAGVVSVFHAVPLLTGPIATWLTDRWGKWGIIQHTALMINMAIKINIDSLACVIG